MGIADFCFGNTRKLNKDKIIKLNKGFHGFVDEDDEPELLKVI